MSKEHLGKPEISLIPMHTLETVADAFSAGNEKFTPHDWRDGSEFSLRIDAALRHLIAFNEGENIDPDSNVHHLGLATANILMLLEYQRTNVGFDDRFIDFDKEEN